MTFLDILVIAIMGLCIFLGAWRGFVRTVLGFANFILAIILTNMLYPHMARFLRGIDSIFDALTASIRSGMGLDAVVYAETRAAQIEIINALPLPLAFREAIIANNHLAVYTAVGAANFADFVAGFLAVIVLNIISMLIVFALVFAGLVVLTRVLNIITKLPVLNSLNKLLGAILGAAWGLMLTWFVLGIVVVYLSAHTQVNVVEVLANSPIAGPLNEANFAVNFILRLFI